MTAADSRGASVHHVIDYGFQIEFFPVQLIGYAQQVFGLHQLKLITNRRNHAAVTFARLLDEFFVAK